MMKKLEDQVTQFIKSIDIMHYKMTGFKMDDIARREKNQHWQEMRAEGISNPDDIKNLIKT